MLTSPPFEDLASAYAHAVYEGFSDIKYEKRDWYIRDRVVMESATRKHTFDDIETYAVFLQIWGSTALGFGGVGCSSVTPAYTVILYSRLTNEFLVYFSGRFAYKINWTDRSNPFFNDVKNRDVEKVSRSDRYKKPVDE